MRTTCLFTVATLLSAWMLTGCWKQAQQPTPPPIVSVVQVAAGAIGQPPVPEGNDFQLSISTQGRLLDEQQFGDIIIKQGAQGQVTRVRDVARVELAARDYSIASQLNGKPAAALVIFQLPGSNAINTSDRVRAKMEELKMNFPHGVDYTVLAALEETEGALVDFGQEQSRQQFLATSAEASQKAADLAHQRYEGGVTDFLSVLDAERTLLEAQDRLAASQTRTATALVAVYKALGGGVPVTGGKQ